jgi:hypothetical protein
MIASFRAWQQEHKLASSLSIKTEVDRRIWVNQSLKELSSLRQGDTTLITDRLVAPYLGKWIKVDGSIENIMEGYQSVVVFLSVPKEFTRHFNLGLRFSKDWEQYLNHLRKGESLIAAGKIVEISSGSIELQNCEVLLAAHASTPIDQQHSRPDQSAPPPLQE